MSSRALARAGLQPVPHIDLPVKNRPQFVNSKGIEVDDEDVASDPLLRTEQHDEAGVDGDLEMEEAEVEEETPGEPLLSLAESLVIPFSLAQTRQHHLTNLLPHIFSHPPIPSHSRPRARPLPRGKLLFPTPTPKVPLPSKEYHAPDKTSRASSTPVPAVEGQTQTDAQPKGKGKNKERDAAPAHEIECIARCTLTIGPISYPGTELWIGKFVEPYHDMLKSYKRREKAQMRDPLDKRPKADKKRPVYSSLLPNPGSSAFAQHRPTHDKPIAGMVPRHPGGPMPRPPPPTAPSPRPPIEPSLIARVNLAATQHPWLSVIIHKAARNSATKEELAKLGRIVARLGKGEGIGEGPLEGLPTPKPTFPPARPPARPPASVAGPSRPTAAVPVRPPAPAKRPTLKAHVLPDESDSELSEEEVDMSGPPQVGGGPIDPELLPQVARTPSLPKTAPQAGPSATQNKPSSSAPIPQSAIATSQPAPVHPPSNFSSSSIDRPPIPTPAIPSTAPTVGSAPRAIPPPRRVHPLPPPFLLVAFKEMPTEKYLLPLGSGSFISRIGHTVLPTGPAPPDIDRPLLPAASQNDGPLKPVLDGSQSRTRQTRGAKVGPADKNDHTSITNDVTRHVEPPFSFSTRSDLPILPGMAPEMGTILLSTIVPTSGWEKVDWPSLEKRIPFYSTEYDEKPLMPNTGGISETKGTVPPPADKPLSSRPPTSRKSEPTSPSINRHGRPLEKEIQLDPKTLLNLSAENFIPSEGPVQAVTIRLEGIDERTWSKMREVVEIVERVEMKALGDAQPDLVDGIPPPPPAPIPQICLPLDPSLQPKLRAGYNQFRKQRFERLLKRVPTRSFPQYRLPNVRNDIKDAATDKWHPRPYPMSTRPLYLTSPPPDGVEMEYEQYETQPKRKRGQAEEEVMFEMPVSLEMLDERVEAGAKKSVNRRVGKLKLDKTAPTGKRHGKRYVPGTTCEGCGRNDVRVWRRGPGGNGTLCNPCGDKFTSGTLGKLAAPGAASSARPHEASQGPDQGETNEGDTGIVKEEDIGDEIAASQVGERREPDIAPDPPLESAKVPDELPPTVASETSAQTTVDPNIPSDGQPSSLDVVIALPVSDHHTEEQT